MWTPAKSNHFSSQSQNYLENTKLLMTGQHNTDCETGPSGTKTVYTKVLRVKAKTGVTSNGQAPGTRAD